MIALFYKVFILLNIILSTCFYTFETWLAGTQFPIHEKESRSRDSPPAACRFSDVIPYAAVRSPGGFYYIGNAVSCVMKKNPAGGIPRLRRVALAT